MELFQIFLNDGDDNNEQYDHDDIHSVGNSRYSNLHHHILYTVDLFAVVVLISTSHLLYSVAFVAHSFIKYQTRVQYRNRSSFLSLCLNREMINNKWMNRVDVYFVVSTVDGFAAEDIEKGCRPLKRHFRNRYYHRRHHH